MKFLKNIPFEIYLIFIWGFSILIVNPLGEFPLNDDWAYVKSVWNLYENGHLTIGNWATMTLVGQVLYGTLFCKLFGFSFISLRFTTLLMSLVGVITFYRLTKDLSSNKRTAAFASLLLLFNPLYFSLSFTFMTDVHFVSIMLLSLYFLNKFIRNEKVLFIILASFCSVTATMIRQPGLILPLTFALIMVLKKQKLNIKLVSTIPFLVSILALIIHIYLFKDEPKNPVYSLSFSNLKNTMLSIHLYQVLIRICITILYIGLFTFPFIFLLKKNIIESFKLSKTKFIIVTIISILLLVKGGIDFPPGNILYNFGLGPKLLPDSYWGDNIYPQINNNLWKIFLSTISIISSITILITLAYNIGIFSKLKFKERLQNISIIKLFISLTTISYVFLLIISKSYFDRYTLPLIPLVVLLIIPRNLQFKLFGSISVIICLLIMSSFSISSTHDYLSWNRARWNALNFLIDNKKVEPEYIDGGFEFNGWFDNGKIIRINKGDKKLWFTLNDKYLITFGAVEGYNKIRSYCYDNTFTFRKDSIYILQKVE